MQAHMQFTPPKSSYLRELHLLVLMKKGKVLIMALIVFFSLVVFLFCFFFYKGRGGIVVGRSFNLCDK